jgi:hypothetical protein
MASPFAPWLQARRPTGPFRFAGLRLNQVPMPEQ